MTWLHNRPSAGFLCPGCCPWCFVSFSLQEAIVKAKLAPSAKLQSNLTGLGGKQACEKDAMVPLEWQIQLDTEAFILIREKAK